MSTNKKYYWLKLKDDFFDSEEMVLLQSMQDGYLYSDILLKMYLKSLKAEGRLMFKDHIPYNPNMIATITKHSVGTVEKALDIFRDLGMIEVLDNNAIYMLDIQSLIGEGSSEADRKKAYRERIKTEQILIEGGQMSRQMSPEIEIDKELDLELDKEKDIYISENDKINWFSKCYFDYTGYKYRRVKKNIEWNPILDDISEEEFNEIVYNFLEGTGIAKDKMTIEYFNAVADRYR